MRKIGFYATVLGLALSIVGCPPAKTGEGDKTGSEAKTGEKSGAKTGDAGEGEGESTGADISHVEVGQKYHYSMANNMATVWEVKDITDGVITYTMTTMMNGEAMGEAQEAKWGETVEAEGEATETETEAPEMKEGDAVTVDGVEFETMIVVNEAGGNKTTTWMTYKGGEPTFPGMYKSETEMSATGTTSTMELTKIE